ncbi:MULTISPECIES: hypothetical protein [Streptomyces]|uniref:hypothetical protein n=1 Tax=Streptomyces TaxID=1883 RepID=UPI001E291E41|nr:MULTISPECIES: hypothetical protein [Streptomyces]UFQ16352.1 hypothetical protein J2N69_15835 [Streptomyces huasconensis]WCL85955.1 hypothetical protein PPN52_15845 [Streptomyces sp. JCM 35825]
MAADVPGEEPGAFKEKRDALVLMAAAHMSRPFPPGARGMDVAGQDLVLLDADAYAYSAHVLKGPLSDRQYADFTRLMAVFDAVLPALDDPYAAGYYARLHDMAVLALEVEALRRERGF